MIKKYCKTCKRETLFFDNFPVNFAKKEASDRKCVCMECWKTNEEVNGNE